jgi:Fe-S-cluster containining protein
MRFEMAARERVSKARETITCTPGCASCCYHPVLVSILEAIGIYRWLFKQGVWTSRLRKKLAEAQEAQSGVTFQVWLLSLTPCPLLDEKNLCVAYDARPFVCRTYFATSDPYNCHPHRLGPGTRLVPREEAVDDYHAKQAVLLKEHGVRFPAMPISQALLLAEQVEMGKLQLDEIDSVLVQDYLEKG